MYEKRESTRVLLAYRNVVGHTIPVAFAGLAQACDNKAESLITLALMVSVLAAFEDIGISPRLWIFWKGRRSAKARAVDRSRGVNPVPVLIVTAWLLLKAYGVFP